MNKEEALVYLHQLFESISDEGTNYYEYEKGKALEKSKESIEIFMGHEELLTTETINLIKEASLKCIGIFTELPVQVARGILRIHLLGPRLSLQQILKAVDICISSTNTSPSQNLNDFITKIQYLRDVDANLITDSNFDKLIHHYPWGRINCVIDELINERSRSPSPFGLLFLPLKKINIVETESIEHKEEIDRQLYPTNMSCYSEYSVSTVTLNYRELEALVSSMCYSETSLQYFLNNYPVNSIWRFFIDADRKAISPRTFDIKEPGYIISCMQAFFNLLSEFDAKVTPEVIKQIHKDATHGVIIFSSHGKFRSRGFSKFGFVAEVSPSGLFELEMTQNELNYTLHKHEEYSYINDNHYKIICGQVDLNFIDRKVQEITDTYEERLKDIPGEVSKVSSEQAIKLNIFLRLENIVIMIQKLERFHPFSDGNCRVFCMLLLYKELIRSELPLCLLTNPNDFDGLSKEEMILEILNGQNRYIELCSGAESLHYAGTYICRSFDISCELEITENQESISLALEAVNKSRESEVRSFFIDKINSYLDNLRYDMTTVASITS